MTELLFTGAQFQGQVAVAVLLLTQVLAQFLEREVQGFVNLFHHHGEIGVMLLWCWSLIAQTIPAPTEKSSFGHIWFYNISHFIAGNARMIGKRSGGDGYIDRRLGTGRFSRQELEEMTRRGQPKE